MRGWLAVLLVTVGCGVEPAPTIDLSVSEWCVDEGCAGDHLPECDADGFCTCDGLVCYEPTCSEIGCTVYDCSDYGDTFCMCEDELADGVVHHDRESCLRTTEQPI